MNIFQTVLRIWDCLFYEGSKILFRVALTLLSRFQSELLKCKDMPAVIDCFKDIYKNPYVLDCNQFLHVSCTIMLINSFSTNTFFNRTFLNYHYRNGPLVNYEKKHR